MARLPIAIAHDYLTQRGGAEKVVLAMARAFPDAPIYTTLYEPATTYPEFRDLDIRPSRLNRVGPLRRNHRAALPVLPVVSETIDIDADVTLTSTSGFAHGFRARGKQLVYCYSPPRWLYQPETYLGEDASRAKRALLTALTPAMTWWDKRAAASSDQYLAISSAVRDRIASTYAIDAEVLPAPFTIDASRAPEPVAEAGPPGYYLCISRLLPYKNVDKVIAAFARRPHRRLVVVGRGPQAQALRASSPTNVTMVSDLTDGQMASLYQNCAGLVAASYEDYGLTPIEAGYYGKPSAVLRWGGFLDTVNEGVSGLYFDQPDPEAIALAVDRLAETAFDPAAITAHVQRFTEPVFAAALHTYVDEL